MVAVAFLLIARETMEGRTLAFDNSCLIALREPGDTTIPRGPLWLKDAMRDVSSLGGVTVVTIIFLLVSGYLLMVKKFRLYFYLLASVAGGSLLMTVLKDLFHRPRPDVVTHLQEISSTSFPSGHSMVSAIMYLTLAAILAKTTTSYKLKSYYVATAVFMTLLIGFSRLFLGVHYPTDVAAGWLAGTLWAATTYLFANYLESRGKIEKEVPPPPQEAEL